MEPINNGIELTGTLFTSAQGDAKDKLAYAEQIWDDDLKKSQKEINANVGKLDTPNSGFLPVSLELAKGLMRYSDGQVVTNIQGDRKTDDQAFYINVNKLVRQEGDVYDESIDSIKIPIANSSESGLQSKSHYIFTNTLSSGTVVDVDPTSTENLVNLNVKQKYSNSLVSSGFSQRTIPRPILAATSTTAGVMSAFDKSVLDTLKTVFDVTKSFVPDNFEATQYSDNICFELTGKVFNDEGNYDSDGVQVTINAATSTTAGVMSANDKVALDKAANFESTFPQYITGLYWVRNLAVQEATDGIHLKIAQYQHFNNNLVVTSTDNYINLPFASSTNGGFMTSTDKSNLDNVVAELPNKANISDIPDIEVKRILDDDTFENVDNVTREDIKKDLFDDMFLDAVGEYGTIDKTHMEDDVLKPYMCNDIWMTYEEALHMYALTNKLRYGGWWFTAGALSGTDIKTCLPIRFNEGNSNVQLTHFVRSCKNLEVLRFDVTKSVNNGSVQSVSYAFAWCTKLKHIYGELNVSYNGCGFNSSGLDGCTLLETLKLNGLNEDLNILGCKNISLESLAYIVNNKHLGINAKAITITVHPEVYAKIMDTTNTEWNALLTAAAAKNITFATA